MSSRFARLVIAAAAFAAIGGAATDLENLAALHGASGEESAVASYVLERLGGRARLDSTGSVTITYGEGGPHLLLAAGLDEPGYAVSEITADGYLRLQRLADPPPNYQFDSYFAGRPVLVHRYGATPLPAVVAAPSVHFASDRGYSSSARGVDRLFVDAGAATREQIERAGVRVLDRATLERRPYRLGGERVSSAWISSRAGAAVLLALAEQLTAAPPPRKVSLAFVAQQHYHNAGLAHALLGLKPDETIVLRPGGGDSPGTAGASGYSSELAAKLLDEAEELGLKLGRSSGAKLSFGPFNPNGPWPEAEKAAVMTLGVEHADTPVETADFAKLEATATLLAAHAGAEGDALGAALRRERDSPRQEALRESDRMYPWEDALRALTAISGVSGDEGRVRAEILSRLPKSLRGAAQTDERGNLIVRLGPASGAPQALFIAHMDEVGFAVTRGRPQELTLETRGGVADDLFSYQALLFAGAGGPVPGLMARFGTAASAAEHAEGVTATVPKAYRRLLGSRINARSLDDRAGCAVLLHALGQLADAARRAQSAVWFAFSVEEETGLLGAEDLAARTRFERVYAIDSLVTSDSPLEPTRIANLKLGEGAAVRAIDNSGIAPRAEVERVAALARDEKIPLQVGVTAGGNDGSKFVPHGAVNVPLSFPLRYSHTAAEVADLGDIDALARLVAALARQELSAP